jgi:hypothetical protein
MSFLFVLATAAAAFADGGLYRRWQEAHRKDWHEA